MAEQKQSIALCQYRHVDSMYYPMPVEKASFESEDGKEYSVVFYHKNCTDGFMSATVFHIAHMVTKYGGKTLYIPINYKEEIPQEYFDFIDGKKKVKVYVVDFSFDYPTIEKISKPNVDLLILDHHESAALMYDGWGSKTYKCRCGGNDCQILTESNQSGAQMAYSYWEDDLASIEHPFVNLYRMTSLVGDRDLFTFKMDNLWTSNDTMVMHTYLNSKPYDLNQWAWMAMLLNHEMAEELKVSETLYEYKRHLTATWGNLSKEVKFQGLPCRIVNCPAEFSSDVCAYIYNKYEIAAAITWCASTEKVFVSLRSNKKYSGAANVRELAQKYGGGGHPNASGFSLSIDQLENLLTGKL